MAKIIDIIQTLNVRIALKNIYSKIDEIIRKVNNFNSANEITGTLSSEQINATPITILEAAGLNKYYIIESCIFYYKAGTNSFGRGSSLTLNYVNSGEIILTAIDLSSTRSIISLTYPNDINLSTTIINDSISLIFQGKPTNEGNGTVEYSIFYKIITKNN